MGGGGGIIPLGLLALVCFICRIHCVCFVLLVRVWSFNLSVLSFLFCVHATLVCMRGAGVGIYLPEAGLKSTIFSLGGRRLMHSAIQVCV